jgi:hypothetical protein
MPIIINIDNFLRSNPDIETWNGTYYCRGSPYTVSLPERFSYDLCRFIGVMHGDGNLSSDRILITDEDLEYHTTILHPLFKSIFNLKLNLYHDEDRGSYYSHIKSSIGYRYLLEVLGFSAGSVRDSLLENIPPYLYHFDQCQKSHYVAGLYDAEGHIKSRQIEIDFSITSFQIREYIANFLYSCGINYTPLDREREGRSTSYEIYIYGRNNVSLFRNLIPMLHPAKIRRLRDMLD